MGREWSAGGRHVVCLRARQPSSIILQIGATPNSKSERIDLFSQCKTRHEGLSWKRVCFQGKFFDMRLCEITLTVLNWRCVKILKRIWKVPDVQSLLLRKVKLRIQGKFLKIGKKVVRMSKKKGKRYTEIALFSVLWQIATMLASPNSQQLLLQRKMSP